MERYVLAIFSIIYLVGIFKYNRNMELKENDSYRAAIITNWKIRWQVILMWPLVEFLTLFMPDLKCN